jgi:hypothetical protein
MSVFWVVAPRCVVEVYQRLKVLDASINTHRPDDGASKELRNYSKLLLTARFCNLQNSQFITFDLLLLGRNIFSPPYLQTITHILTSS